MDLFVYGTLVDDDLVAQLTGRRFPKRAARLRGYRKHTPDGSYPYIVADEAAEVDGFVLTGIDASALRAFDEYEDEGRLYRRLEVLVTVEENLQPAFAYVRPT